MTTVSTREDRARAALLGVAIGDALGMPSQTWTRERIAAEFGFIDDFLAAPAAQPVSHGLLAATITDDTEQTLLLADHLVARGGSVDDAAWAQQLLDWERDVRARGVDDLLGPSTRRAIEALQAGMSPVETGRRGVTNGAAMRIVPVAIASASTPLATLVDRVQGSCRLTHNTAEAIGAAAAVAAFVSAAIDGASLDEALAIAVAAARLGERRGTPAQGASIADTIADTIARAGDARAACMANGVGVGVGDESGASLGVASALTRDHPLSRAAFVLADHIGTSVAAIEAVPMAFALLVLVDGDPWQVAVLAANIGDDTDTIGAIACAMAASLGGVASLPPAAVERITACNALDVERRVAALLRLRDTVPVVGTPNKAGQGPRLVQLSGIVVDLLHAVTRLPLAGEEVESAVRLVQAGGGFNAMAAARRFGATVMFGGTLGTGQFANIARKALDDETIGTLSASCVAIDQGSCVVLVDASAERTFVSWHGAERSVTPAHLAGLSIDSQDWLLLSGYSLYKPDCAAAFLDWLPTVAAADGDRVPGPTVFFDPGPVIADLPKASLDAMLALSHWISVNRAEARSLSGMDDPAEAAVWLAHGRLGAIVRVGSEGCHIATAGSGVRHVPGFAVNAVDTTGAGDTHAGTFIAARLLGWDAYDSAQLANAAAALSTTVFGPATAPDLDSARALLDRGGIVIADCHATTETYR